MIKIEELTASQLAEGYRSGSFDPVDAYHAVQSVIDHREPTLNALWVRETTTALAQAQASALRWSHGHPLSPLDGVPVTVKENIARAGVPMRAGNAAVEAVTPTRDAPLTARLLAAGAVMIGSTVMPDWGMLSSGVSSLHGITRSPWNPDWTTGGSSSGAGAAAAAGYGPIHLGTDIGGSIRLPGTWLGLATLKPTGGRLPLSAPYPGRAAGPLTRSADDVSLAMKVLSGPDSQDWTSLPPIVDQAAVTPVSKLRIAVQRAAGAGMIVDPEVAAAVDSAVAVFDNAGAQITEIDGHCDEQTLIDLDLFWRARSLRDQRALRQDRQQLTLPFIRHWVSRAAGVSGDRLMQCTETTLALQHRTSAALQPFDLVLSPVTSVAAFPAEWPMPFGDSDEGMAHIGFTVPYNMTGHPAGTVNCGFTSDGRPIGLQIAGPRSRDDLVIDALGWFEKNRPATASPVWPITR